MEDGFCFIQRFVSITGKGIKSPYLKMGVSAVSTLYDLAKDERITNAESIHIGMACNCDIVFKGCELLKFLQEYYPDYAEEHASEIIPEEPYKVSAVDYS